MQTLSGFQYNGRRSLYAIGAYGRKVRFSDWEAGKDFQIDGGPYFSIRDCEKIKEAGWERIVFYDKMIGAEPSFVHSL